MTEGVTNNHSIKDGLRIYVIGDIHGKASLLQQLCDKIYEDIHTHDDYILMIYLGDYVDRGEDSKGVIDIILSLQEADIEQVCIMGNHERAMLQFMDDPESIRNWLVWGGAQTLKSYGVPLVDSKGKWLSAVVLSELFNEKMPDLHKKFFNNLKLYHEEGDYVFVHAGVRPGIELEDQDPDDILRIRKDFYSEIPTLDKTIVFGHTNFDEPFEEKGRIGVDTAAYLSDCLTCVVLHADQRYFIQTNT